jgi:hypothetical protein
MSQKEAIRLIRSAPHPVESDLLRKHARKAK